MAQLVARPSKQLGRQILAKLGACLAAVQEKLKNEIGTSAGKDAGVFSKQQIVAMLLIDMINCLEVRF